jgi:hypothetical protein
MLDSVLADLRRGHIDHVLVHQRLGLSVWRSPARRSRLSPVGRVTPCAPSLPKLVGRVTPCAPSALRKATPAPGAPRPPAAPSSTPVGTRSTRVPHLYRSQVGPALRAGRSPLSTLHPL